MPKRSLISLGSLAVLLASLLAGMLAESPAAGAAQVTRATALTCSPLKDGTPVNVKVASRGVCYTFTAVTNAHFTAAVTNPVTVPAGSCLQMIITDASNAVDASQEFNTSPFDLNLTPTPAQAGKTTVTIEPDSGNFCTPATSASLTLIYATDVIGTLTAAKTVNVTVPWEGQNADYTFDGVAGHHVTVQVTNPLTAPQGSCLQIAAYDPSNNRLAASEFNTAPTDINFTPSASEVITVIVSPDSGNFCTPASSSSFSLTYANDVRGTLKSGVHQPIDLKYLGQLADFTFTAVAKQRVSLAVTRPVTSPPGSCMGMSVTDASNAQDVPTTEFSTAPVTAQFTPTVAEAGKTTVTIGPDSGNFCTPANTGTLTLTYTAG